jgi:hypothetical protein
VVDFKIDCAIQFDFSRQMSESFSNIFIFHEKETDRHPPHETIRARQDMASWESLDAVETAMTAGQEKAENTMALRRLKEQSGSIQQQVSSGGWIIDLVVAARSSMGIWVGVVDLQMDHRY